MGDEPMRNAGYVVVGSGGGGADGSYVFASLEDLDGIIADWTALRDRIVARGEKLMQAAGLITPPAEDSVSRYHADATVRSLQKARDHNIAMTTYADGYIDKLSAARAQYSATDEQSAANIRRAGEG